jgi:hypothetical protein
VRRTGARAQPRVYYVCTTHRVRGERFCRNLLSAPMEALDHAVIEALVCQILTPDVVEDVVARASELRAEGRKGSAGRRRDIATTLQRLEKELGRYAGAIAASGPVPELLQALQTRDRRRRELQAEFERLDRAAVPERGEQGDLRALLTARMEDWRGVLQRHPERARETVLRPLLDDRIAMRPVVTTGGRFYEFTAAVSFGGLVGGLIGTRDGAMTVVPPG